jgi:hypothetical protein
MNSFELGQIVITDAAQAVLTTMEIEPLQLIARHRRKDWGDLPHEAKQANHIALSVGGALHSSYTLGAHVVCVTTNPQRSMTTILLANEVASHTSLFSPLS